jgi:hypothetical protein
MFRLVSVLAIVCGLAGCIVAPPYGYAPAPDYGYAYAPGYYAAPTVGIGIGFGGGCCRHGRW